MKHSPQILFVTGKGGVGKTSVSIMLGLAQAQRGLKTIIVQTYGAQRVSSFFQKPPASYTPQLLSPNLYVIRITAKEAIKEYALQQLKFQRVYELVFENRFAKPLLQGAPGLHDAVHLGKIYDLAHREQWPQIIVDAPATGHALSMLRSARTMMELTKIGPMYNSNALVNKVFSDPTRTNIVLVSLLEELPVQETIELWNSLNSDQQKQCCALIQNKVLSAPPNQQEALPDQWKEIALNLLEKRREQQEQARITHSLPLPHISIPSISDQDPQIWGRWGEQILEKMSTPEGRI
jgi:anion-transporting  ArsA/GET3 family ATPase